MAMKRVRARSGASARRKCRGPKTVVTKVNYIKGTMRDGKGTYSVTTKRKK